MKRLFLAILFLSLHNPAFAGLRKTTVETNPTSATSPATEKPKRHTMRELKTEEMPSADVHASWGDRFWSFAAVITLLITGGHFSGRVQSGGTSVQVKN